MHSHIPRRILLVFITLIIAMIFLFSYFFANSRADRITSNEEYIESLKEASRGKRLAGNVETDGNSVEMNGNSVEIEGERTEIHGDSLSQPRNLFEELWFQLKAVFNVR